MQSILTNFAWLFEITGFLVGGIGAVLVLMALFADRSRGRRRCPRCWYSMDGAPGLRCPECGGEARSDRRLFKTRRRWVFALLALGVVLIGLAVRSAPAVARDGAMGALPTPVVLAFLEMTGWAPPGDGRWGDELERRFAAGKLGRFKDRAVRLMLRHWLIEYRRQWPRDVAMRVVIQNAPWAGGSAVIRARLADGPEKPWIDMSARRMQGRSEWTDGSVEIGTLPEGCREMVLEIEVGTPGRGGHWKGKVSYPVRIGGAASDLLSAEESEELNRFIITALIDDGSLSTDRITLPLARPGMEDVSIALRIEYRRGKEVVAVATVWDNAGEAWVKKNLRNPSSILPVRWLPVPEIAAGNLVSVDSVRIVPDVGGALMDRTRKKYWSGELTVPWESAASPGASGLRDTSSLPPRLPRRPVRGPR